MNHELDDWITNYESAQRTKHSKLLKEIKHEFTQRTKQQRRDRLDKDDTLSTKRVERSTKVRRRVATTQHQGT